jgi:hypothetical protein
MDREAFLGIPNTSDAVAVAFLLTGCGDITGFLGDDSSV